MEMDCSETVILNYTDQVHVWHNDNCFFDVGIDKEKDMG
jgi:hypothetical protein